MARTKYWLQTWWGLPLPPSIGGFQQQNQVIFNIDPGHTLIRTRVDLGIVSYIENTDTHIAFDPEWYQYVIMLFGMSWVSPEGGMPPSLIDSGGDGVDWLMWDTLYPIVDMLADPVRYFNMGVSWTCNGRNTLESLGRRGPADPTSGAQVCASLGYYDPTEQLSQFTPAFDATTYLNIGVKCLFEAAPGE